MIELVGLAIPVILFDCESEFSRANWASSIHEGIIWFNID
jgi:hypothetical protein